jgi:hypothetical protein
MLWHFLVDEERIELFELSVHEIVFWLNYEDN